MKITTVLFDLDGTLLPLDQDAFMKLYFGGLTAGLVPFGYDPKALVDAIWAGTADMVRNDGSKSNEQVFWDRFVAIFGEKSLADVPRFEAYYQTDFDDVRAACSQAPAAKEIVKDLQARGKRVVLATNPLFPAIATEKRIAWAGLSPDDFLLYTTYENSRHCKPNPDYYRDILREIGAEPSECLMVGNDVDEDMIASTLGMQVFLLTDCLLNRHDLPISHYPHGNFSELAEFLRGI